MLLIKRRPGEIIHIGPDIRIVINAIKGQQCQVGIEAPDHIEILRDELIQPGNVADSTTPP